jgi:hypothetical protein
MNAPSDHNAANGLRRWWLSPPRHGLALLLAPYEYRHLRFFGILRLVGAAVAAVPGAICLAYSAYGWAAFFLGIGALNLAGGCWELSIDRSASA